MTGRDLIIYILKHQLEDELIFDDGHLIGFMNELEAAVKFDVGVENIKAWVDMKMLDGIKIGNLIYIPANAENPKGAVNNG